MNLISNLIIMETIGPETSKEYFNQVMKKEKGL